MTKQAEPIRRALRWIIPVDDQWHQIGGGKVLHVASRDRGIVEVWTLEESQPDRFDLVGTPTVPPRTVRAYGTGHPIADVDVEHVGTAIDGPLVWHVFGAATEVE